MKACQTNDYKLLLFRAVFLTHPERCGDEPDDHRDIHHHDHWIQFDAVDEVQHRRHDRADECGPRDELDDAAIRCRSAINSIQH